MTADRNDRGLDGSAFDERMTDLQAVFAANGEHFVEGNLGAGFGAKEFNLDGVADGDAVLLAARLDDCVHG